jgi:hypothetical protein
MRPNIVSAVGILGLLKGVHLIGIVLYLDTGLVLLVAIKVEPSRIAFWKKGILAIGELGHGVDFDALQKVREGRVLPLGVVRAVVRGGSWRGVVVVVFKKLQASIKLVVAGSGIVGMAGFRVGIHSKPTIGHEPIQRVVPVDSVMLQTVILSFAVVVAVCLNKGAILVVSIVDWSTVPCTRATRQVGPIALLFVVMVRGFVVGKHPIGSILPLILAVAAAQSRVAGAQ